MGNNLYAKPLAKSKLFPLESLSTFIEFSYLYEIFIQWRPVMTCTETGYCKSPLILLSRFERA